MRLHGLQLRACACAVGASILGAPEPHEEPLCQHTHSHTSSASGHGAQQQQGGSRKCRAAPAVGSQVCAALRGQRAYS